MMVITMTTVIVSVFKGYSYVSRMHMKHFLILLLVSMNFASAAMPVINCDSVHSLRW
jgi:hypothetical protein